MGSKVKVKVNFGPRGLDTHYNFNQFIFKLHTYLGCSCREEETCWICVMEVKLIKLFFTFWQWYSADTSVHRFMFCLNYMMFPLVLYPPLFLRQCIAIFAVAEGWLLLDIGWFVLFLHVKVQVLNNHSLLGWTKTYDLNEFWIL